jgi:hypothetical protein
MKHLTSINRKAARLESSIVGNPLAAPQLTGADPATPASAALGAASDMSAASEMDVVALQQNQGPPQQPAQPHIPLGCSLVFSPGWEADRTGGTAGLCQPVERDLFDCHTGCYWPAHVPDQMNHAPDWTSKCAAAAKDWRKIDLVFP